MFEKAQGVGDISTRRLRMTMAKACAEEETAETVVPATPIYGAMTGCLILQLLLCLCHGRRDQYFGFSLFSQISIVLFQKFCNFFQSLG